MSHNSYRVTQAACDAMSASSLSWGGGGLGATAGPDEEGLMTIYLAEDVTSRIERLTPSLDLCNPLELSEWIIDLTHGEL